MSRIHRILSKAEQDGTVTRLTWPPDAPGADEGLPAATGWRPLPAAFDPLPVAPGEATELVGGRPVFGVKMSRLLVTAHEPFSAAAEQYRLLRTRMSQTEGDDPRRVISVTSPGRGEGKSVTAANLALALAQEFERRTLLVDADLRHARLHTLLGITREPGLVDVLDGSAPLEEALLTLPGHRLQVLPAGSAHTQPAELLASAQMKRLFELLRRSFDRVVVDSAAAQTSDAGALDGLLDGTLLVVRAGRSTRPAIARALSLIPATQFLGLVLNDSRRPDGPSPV